MTTKESQEMERRELLRAVGQGICLGGLAVLSGMLFLRQKHARDLGLVCDFELPCGQCGLLANCTLPRARRFRKQKNNPVSKTA